MVEVRCPRCDENVDIGEEPKVGDEVECLFCGAKLKVARRGRRWVLEVIEEGGEEEEW